MQKKIIKQGRGTYESRVNKNAIVVVQWAHNKPVCLASSFVGADPAGTMKRYSKEAHRKIDVPCPRAVAVYNQTMGGVDLSDMYMAMYKIPTRAKRWYFAFTGYSLELALTNSWLQYKRDCQLLQTPKNESLPLGRQGLRAPCCQRQAVVSAPEASEPCRGSASAGMHGSHKTPLKSTLKTRVFGPMQAG